MAASTALSGPLADCDFLEPTMTDSLKLVTWNIFSYRARVDFLALFLDAVQPDVIAIQEVKLEADRVPVEVFESRGYHVAIHGQPQWNGVLLASKQPLEDVHRGLPDGDEGQARLIAATTFGIRFVNLYCPQGSSAESPKFAYKLRFFDALGAWIAANHTVDTPLCVLGDINIAPDPEDVYSVDAMAGVPTYHPEEHKRWAALVDWGLTDAVKGHVEPGKFSFWEYRAGAFHKNKGFRIDHFLVTSTVLQRVQSAQIHRSWRKKRGTLKPSDHAPVELIISA